MPTPCPKKVENCPCTQQRPFQLNCETINCLTCKDVCNQWHQEHSHKRLPGYVRYYADLDSGVQPPPPAYVPFYAIKLSGQGGIREQYVEKDEALMRARVLACANRGQNVHVLVSIGMFGPSNLEPSWTGLEAISGLEGTD